jgi:hypothetical protein
VFCDSIIDHPQRANDAFEIPTSPATIIIIKFNA